MSAAVQINGVTQRSATVAFGSTVTLTNGNPTGTAQKWEVLDYPGDLDDSGPDFSTNFSAWSTVGDGTFVIVQSSSPFASVSFKPDVTGTYLVRLTSTESGGDVSQTAIVRVKEVHSGEFLPAVGESSEDDVRQGWKKIVDGRLKRLAKRAQGYVRVANVSGSSIARGKVVKLTASVDGHTVSPATNPGGSAAAKSEKIFTVTVADNTASGAADADYAILDETLANNSLGWAQKFGLFEGKSDVNYAGFTAGAAVYFNSTGDQVNAAPGSGVAVPLGVLLETGSTGTMSVALAGRSVNQLLTGRPGGNTITFGLNASDSGTITSTSHATKGSVNIGSTPILTISESLTVASGSAAVLDLFKIPGVTVTITGVTGITTADGFNYAAVYGPTLTDASAVAITAAATFAVMGPPTMSDSATASNLTAARITGSWTNTAGNGHALRVTPTFAPTSGSGVFNTLALQYTINQTGGANGTVTGLLLNATETAVVGTHNLLDLQVGGVTKHLVKNDGTVAAGTAASANLTFTSTTNATKGKIYFGTAQTAWIDEVNGNPRFEVDGTGLTTTVPVLIKNAKSLSGIVAQVTGSVATGHVINNSGGTQSAAFGLAVSSDDWITGTLANDVVLASASGGKVQIGALSGATPVLTVDTILAVTAASGLNLDTVKLNSQTVSISGTTTINALHYMAINPPTLSGGSSLTITSASTLSVAGPPVMTGAPAATSLAAFRVGGTWLNSADVGNAIRVTPTFAPTTGTGSFNALLLQYTINQTGGANGTIRGIYINSTETALVGVHNLVDFQVGGTSKFTMVSTGATTLDSSASSSAVPLTVKNGTAGSGIIAQATGTARTGFVLANTSGTSKAAWGLVVSANDFVTGSAAGDAVLGGDSTKLIHFAALGGSAPVASVDLVNSRVGIGTIAPSVQLHVKTGAQTQITAETTLTSSNGAVKAASNAGSGILSAYGSSASGTQFGANKINGAFLSFSVSGVAGIGTSSSSDFVVGTNDTERLRVDSLGNVSIGTAALVTTATDGFLYIPTCAGTPTGVPTSKTGRAAQIYDTTNNKLYVYNGAWKGVTLA